MGGDFEIIHLDFLLGFRGRMRIVNLVKIGGETLIVVLIEAEVGVNGKRVVLLAFCDLLNRLTWKEWKH